MELSIRLDSSLAGEPLKGWGASLGPAQQVLRCDARGQGELRSSDGAILRAFDSPIDALNWLDEARREHPGQRWVGYLSYELGRWFENLPALAVDDLNLPLLVFTRHAIREEKVAPWAPPAQLSGQLIGSNFRRDGYLAAVAQAIEYIGAGDIFQVNLAQRFEVATAASTYAIYSRLQQLYPASYAALLDYGDFALISNSPELFLQVGPDGNRHVLTRPIKGTRPRGDGMREELAMSLKDQAELNMIIDLERNDLGRVCRIGSVRVPRGREIETHPTVYHGAANVEGVLRDDVTLVDLLRATFPGGSITGAPKIRAMQIIEELELNRRGPYCGAIGYLDCDGSLTLNVAIRTLIATGQRVYVPVGGGVVADSIPESEYDETLVKAHAAFAALGIRTES